MDGGLLRPAGLSRRRIPRSSTHASSPEYGRHRSMRQSSSTLRVPRIRARASSACVQGPGLEAVPRTLVVSSVPIVLPQQRPLTRTTDTVPTALTFRSHNVVNYDGIAFLQWQPGQEAKKSSPVVARSPDLATRPTGHNTFRLHSAGLAYEKGSLGCWSMTSARVESMSGWLREQGYKVEDAADRAAAIRWRFASVDWCWPTFACPSDGRHPHVLREHIRGCRHLAHRLGRSRRRSKRSRERSTSHQAAHRRPTRAGINGSQSARGAGRKPTLRPTRFP